MKHILKCCVYTMKSACPECGKETTSPRPPKFSPEDNYGKYRRKVKEQSRKEQGLV